MINSSKVIKIAKKIANNLHGTKSRYFPCPSELLKWTGVSNIYINNFPFDKVDKCANDIIKKYTILKGDCTKLKIIDDNTVGYKDHVSRIYTIKSKNTLPDAIYTFPLLSNEYPIIKNILNSEKQIADFANSVATKYNKTILTKVPEPFEYEKMENGACLEHPLALGYPSFLQRFSKNSTNFQNVLHLPIKISKSCEDKFLQEKRITSNGQKILHNKIYLPRQLFELTSYIETLAQIELRTNPYFMSDSYMFLSISDSYVLPNDTHRRGGWHIDGHQGYERLIDIGKQNIVKHVTDRQYILCDTLPTEFYPMNFNFQNLRKKHVLDSVNIQDQIEKMTAEQELLYPKLISTIKTDQINFFTTYMVHRGQTNNTDKPIKRKFIRLICSTYSRDRFGNSINPIFGPLNPLKIKTVTDIYEVNNTQ